jgi:hypothetical protein
MIDFIVGSNFDLFTINCDNPIGANYGAIHASGAFIGISRISIPVTFMIDFTGYRDDFCRACTHAHLATFTALNINDYNSSDFSHLIENLKSYAS